MNKPSPFHLQYVSALLACTLLVTPLAPVFAQSVKVKRASTSAATQGAGQSGKGGTVGTDKHITLPAPSGATSAPAITATKVDAYPSAPGQALPGDTITYTVTVTNTGTANATNVVFNDTVDPNTSLVPSSAHVQPLTTNDTYTTVGNTLLEVGVPASGAPSVTASGSVYDNDSQPNNTGGSDTFQYVSNTNPAHGSVTFDGATGHFSYLPAVGYVGADSFTYTVKNSNNSALTDTATVSITVGAANSTASATSVVWYVDNSYTGANGASDGRSTRPFTSLAPVNGAGDSDAAGDIIYLFTGNAAYTTGLTLENNELFIGNGVALVVNTFTLRAAGTRPTLGNSGGNAITLASGNTVNGLNTGTTSATGAAIFGSSFGTATVNNLAIGSGAARALDLSTGTLAIAIDSITSSGSGTGINLSNTGGTLTVSGAVSISNAVGINVAGASFPTVNLNGGLAVTSTAGAGIIAAGGTFSIAGTTNTISATGGPGVDLTNVTLSGGATFSTVSSTGSTTTGMNFSTVTGAFTANGGSITGGASGAAFKVNAGASNITYTGTISQNNAQRVVDVQGTTGGTLTLSGTVTGGTSSTGVHIGDTTAVNGNVSFTTLNLGTSGARMTNQAVTLTNGTGTYSLGVVSIFTSNQPGIVATNADGTINSTSGTVDTIGASAISIDGPAGLTTLGMTLTTVNVDKNGATIPAKGILVQDTNGSFAVNGTGTTAGSGGTIQNSSAIGGDFRNASNITLKNMNFTNNATVNNAVNTTCGDALNGTNGPTNCNSNISLLSTSTVTLNNLSVTGSKQIGIDGNGVSNLTLTNMTVTGNGNEVEEDGVQLVNESGTLTISGGTYKDNAANQFEVQNSASGTLTINADSATFSNTAYPLSGTTPSNTTANGGLFVATHGSNGSIINPNVTNCTFANIYTQAFRADMAGNTGMTIHFGPVSGAGNGNTVNNAGGGAIITGTNTGAVTFVIRNSNFQNDPAVQPDQNSGGVISARKASPANGTWTGTIQSNTVGTNGVAKSGCVIAGCNGLSFDTSNASGNYTTTIDSNHVFRTSGHGINVAGGGGSDSSVIRSTIQNNILGDPEPNGLGASGQTQGNAIFVEAGGGTGDTTTVKAQIDTNTASGAWSQGFNLSAIRVRERFATTAFCLTNYNPATSYGGQPAGSNTSVSAFLASANPASTAPPGNTVATATQTGGTITGPSCPLLLALGGISSAHDILPLMWNFDDSQLSAINVSTLAAPASAASDSLSQPQLDSIVNAATQRWADTGLTQAQLATLRAVKFEVTDLSGSYLGEASGDRILVDRNAQGKGWFIDAAPLSDASFFHAVSATRLYTSPTGAPAGHVDLLTAIEHEMGHRLGLDDTYSASDRDSLMYGYLTVGERRLPTSMLLTHAHTAIASGRHFLALGAERDSNAQRAMRALPAVQSVKGGPSKSSPAVINGAGGTVSVTIGTLVPNDSVTITFQVIIDNPYAGGPNVSNQGTVSGSNFANVLTDDPATGTANDPTLTPVNSTDIRVNDAKESEPSSGTRQMLFTVTLTQPAGGSGLTVNYATANGGGAAPATGGASCDGATDYLTATGMLGITAGSKTGTIPVTICADAVAEGDETLLLNISSPSSGNIVDGQAVGTITANVAGTFLISELRTSGPGGPGDDFVELYNNTNSPLTVAASDASAGYGVYKMGTDCNATPVLIGTIPNGTVIPARGHYLVVGSQYSLADYGGAGAAAGDLTLTSDIEADHNVAVFTTANVNNLSTVGRLDAVGFGTNTGGTTCDLLREGTNLPPVSGSVTEHSFFRSLLSGQPADTNDNASDFLFADTQGTFISGVPQHLGAPGPENLASPINRGASISKSVLIDATQSSSAAPNRVRDTTSNPANNSTNGTISIRRRFTNNSGGNITRLRFRVVNMTTFPTPGGGVADLRLLSSTLTTASGVNDSTSCSASGAGAAPCTVNIQGTTRESPPAQPNGGGYNSTVAAGTITSGAPLAPGASINVQFLLGVQTTGSFTFLVILEALP